MISFFNRAKRERDHLGIKKALQMENSQVFLPDVPFSSHCGHADSTALLLAVREAEFWCSLFCHVTIFINWSAVSANTPNIKWHMIFACPRTRTILPPNSSFNRPFARSDAVRPL